MGLELSICDGFKGAENGKGSFCIANVRHLTAKRDHIFATPKSPLPDECTAQCHRIYILKAGTDRQAAPREPRRGRAPTSTSNRVSVS